MSSLVRERFGESLRIGDDVLMRLARLFTNETCNQRCSFCHTRREREDPAFASGPALGRRLNAAIESGAKRLVLTGGEPLLRPDLPAVVRAARMRGVERIELETNGLLLDLNRLHTLRDAGLDLIRVHLPGWGDVWERSTGLSSPFSALLRTLELLRIEEMPFEVSLPVVRDTVEDLWRTPEELLNAGFQPESLVVLIPHTAPDEASLAPVRLAAACLERLARSAKTHGFTLRFDGDATFPPCLLSNPLHLAHLYALTPGGRERADRVRIPACDRCSVADRCPGMPVSLVDRLEGLEPRPIADERVRRRLTVIGSVEEQMAREIVTRSMIRNDVRGEVPSTIVRVNFLCNQSCHFCFVSTHLPTPPEKQVRDAIIEGARLGGDIVLSGGEPTLNPLLPRWVRLAKEEGARWVELQTNATRLGDEALLQELVEAGVDLAFVSLHGSTAETSDAVTQAPGTFVKTLAGLDNLEKSPILLRVNFVFCELNRTEFPDFVRLLATRWPKAALTISVAGAFTDLVPRTQTLISRFSDLKAPLGEGLELAHELGVEISGFESMCGIPMCQVPGDASTFLTLPSIGEEDEQEFLRTPECLECDLRTRCHGVRRSYAALYGIEEFEAVRLPTSAVQN